MGAMAVTNVSAGVGASVANVQLVEIPEGSTLDQFQPNPMGNTVLQLIVPIDQCGQYVPGTTWDMTLSKRQAAPAAPQAQNVVPGS